MSGIWIILKYYEPVLLSNTDVTKTGNGEWGMGNGEWEIENGKWEIENGKLIFFTLTFYNVE